MPFDTDLELMLMHTYPLREGGLNEDQQLELLRKIEQQARTRHGISDPTDG